MVEEVFSGSAIEKMIVTNTVPLSKKLEMSPLIQVVSVAPLFSLAIESILTAKSISSLY